MDTAYPPRTTAVHAGLLKLSVRGGAAVAPTSVPIASSSRIMAIPISTPPDVSERVCSGRYRTNVALATLTAKGETGRVEGGQMATERRQVLAEAATDYVLEHGLLDLSLRPLAKALGTSDRMLLYHFRDKPDLVATVLRVSNDRSVSAIRAMTPSAGPHAAVLDLWTVVSAA